MKNLMKNMFDKVKSVFGEPYEQVTIPYVITREEQDNDLISRVRAFNRVPLYKPTIEESKAEADTMRDLKDWVRRLSDTDRAIVMGRKPWEIMNHMLGILPIDGVAAVGRGASYDYVSPQGVKFDFINKQTAANENTMKTTSALEARGMSQVMQQLNQQGGNDLSFQAERKPEPSYAYEPPRPSAAFMAAHGKYA
jgi:hypothetical protein